MWFRESRVGEDPENWGEWWVRMEYGRSVPFSQSEAQVTAAQSLQSCPTLCDPIDGSPPGSPVPGISLGKNTGVGCHFLLQCMKVKTESEVAQSCLTLRDPMDCSLPGSSGRYSFQARVLEWVTSAFSNIGGDLNIFTFVLLEACGLYACWPL